MSLLLYKRFSVYTHKPVYAVALLLLRAIPPSEKHQDQPELQEYFGSIWEDSFFINPNINYMNRLYPLISRKNPFTPLYRGKLIPTNDGTEIRIQPIPEPIRMLVGTFFIFLFLIPATISVINFLNGRELTYTGLSFIGTMIGLGMVIGIIRTVLEENTRLRDFLRRTVSASSSE